MSSIARPFARSQELSDRGLGMLEAEGYSRTLLDGLNAVGMVGVSQLSKRAR